MNERSQANGGRPLKRREFLGRALATGALAAGGAMGEMTGASAAAQSPGASGAGSRPSAGRRPNILILHADQHNARVLGCAGHPDVKTPHLDQLAARGMRFERAYCQDAICVPSRTSLMTGLYPRTTGVLWNSGTDDGQIHEGVRVEPMAAWFKARGYLTGAFGRRHLCIGADTGWDVTCTTINDPPGEAPPTESYLEWVREIGQWDAFQRDLDAEIGNRVKPSRAAVLSCRISNLTPEATREAWTARKTIEFIRKAAADDQPFFAWVPMLHPHQPYTPLPEYYKMYDQAKLTLPPNIHEPGENLPPQLEAFRSSESIPWCLGLAAKDERLYRDFLACYYGCVSQIDHYMGQILDELEKVGQADNTIVIYTADHGDFATHHGLIEKYAWGHNVYEETLRVPFIVSWPGRIRQGEVRQDLVEETDVYPTLLELAGVEAPEGYGLAGRSIAATLTEGKPTDRRYAFCESPIMVTAVGERYKLGVWRVKQRGNYPDMLFDRVADPYEVRNLAGQPQVAAEEKALRVALDEWAARTPRVVVTTPPPMGGYGWPERLRGVDDDGYPKPAGKAKSRA